MLDGQRIDLVRNAADTAWVARRNGAQLEVRDRGDGIMFMYDGEGRTYTFSAEGPGAGTRLVGGNLFLLVGISAPGGNSVNFIYQFGAPALPGGGSGLAIDLLHVRFNKSPTTAGCFKNDVLFSYDLPATAPLSMSMLGTTALVRVRKISKVTVFSRPSCTDPDVTLRTYTFNYQPDPDTQLPRLQSVTMNGQKNTPEQNITLPVAAYTYGAATGVDGKFTYRKTKSIPLPTGADSAGISGSIGQIDFPRPNFLYDQRTSYFTWQSLTDINGDGRPDLTFREGPELMVAFNTPSPDGTTFSGVAGQQLTGGPGNDLTGRSLEARSSKQDRSILLLGKSSDMVWRQSIDVNGDGRLDLIDARDTPETWVVYMNTPSIDTPNRIAWVRRKISIARLVQYLKEAGHDVNSEYLPLAKRTTGHDTSFRTCWEWQRDPTNDVFQWVRKKGPAGNCLPELLLRHPDRSTTEWAVRDVNGDSYPDVVYNASPIQSFIASDEPPAEDGSFEGQVLPSAQEAVVDFTGSSDVKAMFNVAGVHLLNSVSGTEAFSSPILFAAGAGCGVEQWRAEILSRGGGVTVTDPGSSVQVCGFDDVNGDGLADRLTFELWSGSPAQRGTAALGTGDLNAPFSAPATIRLPGLIARVNVDLRSGRPSACPIFPNSDYRFPTERTAGLRDLTSDGIPDYISGHKSRGATFWTVSIGTGTGFAPPRPIDVPTAFTGFQLSLESVTCPGVISRADTPSGLYDIDGDGRPEVIVLNDTNFDVYQLNAERDPNHPFEGNVPSSPTEGRLVTVDNGYGAITRIGYRSAKEDVSTHHRVPFPEIVVTAVGTTDTFGSPLLSPTQYAYGGAELIFDPALDAFRFPGYRRSLEHRNTSHQVIPPPTEGVATITDTYPLEPFDENMDANARFKRYLKTGRVSDVTMISGNVGTDAWALLSTNIDNDARRIGSTHYDWDTRILPTGPTGNEYCIDMVYPYDYFSSVLFQFGHLDDVHDQCVMHGFVFPKSTFSWRGTPGTASPLTSDATVLTDTKVQAVDEFGRITSVAEFNDRFRSDDDLCTQTVYATPTGTNERVLSAPVSRTTTSCATPTVPLVTYSKDTWEYDTSPAGVKLPAGKVSNGFVTAHTVSRLNLDTGASLGDIRVFDATYDPATGRLRTLTQTRDDGARQKHTWAYDPFGLVPVRVRTEAINANGTRLPLLQTVITRDPITLNARTTTDPNGTQNGNTFDGFDRALLSTVTPPGGTAGALSSISYLGFAVGQTGGRRIVQKVFTDPVAPASVGTAAGRTGTVFLDQLGRELRTEVALGADYANQTVVTGDRTYDLLGRVRFETDPHLSTDGSLYGTTYQFNTDGTPSCFIRGHGQQAFGGVTDEPSERYPTCFSRFFANNQEAVHVRDAASLLAGSPQAGVVEETVYSAIGRALSRSTYKPNPNLVPLERATFRYDALGNLASMARSQDPLSTATVTTSWRYDSLGQVLQLEEPDSAPQFRSYDNWGDLTQVQWLDTATNPATDRRTITRYDALGRITHSEDKTNNVVDAATVNDFLYDQPVNVTTPPVLATNVLGRLAKATFPTGAVSFSYDGLGRVNVQTFTDTTTAPVGVYVEKHAYHGDGSLSALDLLLPDTGFRNERVDYSYDSAGRTRSVKYSDGTTNQNLFNATGSADIDPLGRIRQAQFGLATYTASYADTGRRLLNSVKVTSPSLGSSREISYPVLQGSIAAYDPLGRERSRREFKNGKAASAIVSTYDALGRLAASSLLDDQTDGLSVQRKVTYDPLGNILKQDDLSGPTAPGAVQLSYQITDRDRICSIGYGVAAPSPICNVKYDGVGNIISHPMRTNGTRTLSYFANGRVKEIKGGNGTRAVFRYDAFGAVQQLVLTGNTPDTRHDQHFGGLITKRDEVVAGTRKSVLTRSIPAPGVIATRHGPTATPTATWTFAFGEGRGNRFFTDQNGALVQDVDYQPYGEAKSTGAQPGAPTYTSAQWNGGDALVALGLSQLGARLYDPVIGRFLSRDPLFIPRTSATTNPYAFAMNDPINMADPSGLYPELSDEEIGALGAAGLVWNDEYFDDVSGGEVIEVQGNAPSAEGDPQPTLPIWPKFVPYPEWVETTEAGHRYHHREPRNPLRSPGCVQSASFLPCTRPGENPSTYDGGFGSKISPFVVKPGTVNPYKAHQRACSAGQWPSDACSQATANLALAMMPMRGGTRRVGGLRPVLEREGFDLADDLAFYHGTSSTSPLLKGNPGFRGELHVTGVPAVADYYASRAVGNYGGSPTTAVVVLPRSVYNELQGAGLVKFRAIYEKETDRFLGQGIEFAEGTAETLTKHATVVLP